MRPVRVKWGKLNLELPAEIILYLLFKALPDGSLQRDRLTLETPLSSIQQLRG